MLYYENRYHSGGAISGYLENWTLDEVGLGTLILEGGNEMSNENIVAPSFLPGLLAVCAIAAGGVMLLGFAGILAVVIVFVVSRIRRR